MRSLLYLRLITRSLYSLNGTGLPRLAEHIRYRSARWATGHPEKALIWINDFCGDSCFVAIWQSTWVARSFSGALTQVGSLRFSAGCLTKIPCSWTPVRIRGSLRSVRQVSLPTGLFMPSNQCRTYGSTWSAIWKLMGSPTL